MTKICQFDGCGRKHKAKGFCQIHYLQAYHKLHPQNLAIQKAQWYAANVERESVRGHHYFICRHPRKEYTGLPFFDGWNPDKGGSFDAGGQWIIEHLGRRPGKRYELHIVDRRLGFMPNNLQWVPKEKHIQEELINRLLLENQNLRKENEILRASK